jgi:hypothetical protein
MSRVARIECADTPLCSLAVAINQGPRDQILTLAETEADAGGR